MAPKNTKMKFEVKPPRYLTERKTQSRQWHPRAVVARHYRGLADPEPDNPPTYITGRYQEVGGKFTFHVNQAGKHIECWKAKALKANTKLSKKIVRLSGDLQDDGTYTLYTYPNPKDIQGVLRPGQTTDLEIVIGGVSERLVLNRPAATFSEHAMKSLSVNDLARADEFTPLTRQWTKWLIENLKPIQPLVHDFRHQPMGEAQRDKHKRYMKAKLIDDYIGAVLSTASPDGWHHEDLDLARFRARQILSFWSWEHKHRKMSHLDWLQHVLSYVVSDGENWSPLIHLRDHLGLRADKESDNNLTRPQHTYTFEFYFLGAAADFGVGIGAFSGWLTIKKDYPKPWTHKYYSWIGDVSFGWSLSAKAGFTTAGTAKTYNPWNEADFPGWIEFVSVGSFHGGMLVAPSYGSVGALFVDGIGFHPTLMADMAGISWMLEVGGGFDIISGQIGRIFNRSKPFPTRDETYISVRHDYAVEARLTGDVHFEFGSSLLTDAGRQALRVFAAIELRCLRSETSRLVITGHADRVDKEIRNIDLSLARAQNVEQALKDILGNDLGIPDDRIYTLGQGEYEATKARDLEHSRNPKWRKVELVLNSRFALTLRGPQ